MKKNHFLYTFFLLLISISYTYECNSLKLDNISSNRALSTLRALGYNIIEHTNVYVDDIKTDNLLPMDEIDIASELFIIDIPLL